MSIGIGENIPPICKILCYDGGMEETMKPVRGRPRIHAEEPARVDVRMPPALRRQIRIAAAEDDLGLGEWLLLAAQEKLARRAAPAPE